MHTNMCIYESMCQLGSSNNFGLILRELKMFMNFTELLASPFTHYLIYGPARGPGLVGKLAYFLNL